MSLDEVYCDLTDVVQNRTVSSEMCPEHGEPPLSYNMDGAHTPDKDEVSKPGAAKDEGSKNSLCWCRRERVVWNIVEELRKEIETTTQLTGNINLCKFLLVDGFRCNAPAPLGCINVEIWGESVVCLTEHLPFSQCRIELQHISS